MGDGADGSKKGTKDGTDLMWLMGTPATDVNFQGVLARADEATVRQALEQIEGLPGNRMREKALRQRLAQFTAEPTITDQAVLDTANRQERATGMEIATLQDERDAKDQRAIELAEREMAIAQCYKAIGQVQAANMFTKFADVSGFVWLSEVKAKKLYKDIPGIGTWDKFCESVGMCRQHVDDKLKNLAVLGEEFFAVCQRLSVGYRDLRKLRQLTLDGTIAVSIDCLTIGEEVIPIDEDHHEDLQAAIERVLESRSKLTERVEKLEGRLDDAVKEETKGLKAEVKALVKEVRRLKPFDPEERDLSFAAEQLQGIKDGVLCVVALMSSFIVDERVQREPIIMGQVEGHMQTVELALSDLRQRWERAVNLFEA